MAKQYYYISEGQYVARCDVTPGYYENAEVLRNGKWVPTTPAELIWNAQPITEEWAMRLMQGQARRVKDEGGDYGDI